jgi:hypothetical protein
VKRNVNLISIFHEKSETAKAPTNKSSTMEVWKIAGRRLIATVQERPIIFNTLVGGTLCAGSDAVAQELEQQKPSFDSLSSPSYNGKGVNQDVSSFDGWRFASAGLIGAFFGGFIYPAAYARLDAVFIGTGLVAVVKKSLVEIATVGVTVNGISMAVRGLMTGRGPADVMTHVTNSLPEVTKTDLIVWFPYNLVAFSVIPAVLRPATTSCMEALWQTYISLCSHNYNNNSEHESVHVEDTPSPTTTLEAHNLTIPVSSATPAVVNIKHSLSI